VAERADAVVADDAGDDRERGERREAGDRQEPRETGHRTREQREARGAGGDRPRDEDRVARAAVEVAGEVEQLEPVHLGDAEHRRGHRRDEVAQVRGLAHPEQRREEQRDDRGGRAEGGAERGDGGAEGHRGSGRGQGAGGASSRRSSAGRSEAGTGVGRNVYMSTQTVTTVQRKARAPSDPRVASKRQVTLVVPIFTTDTAMRSRSPYGTTSRIDRFT
jgi:hypothetical protein